MNKKEDFVDRHPGLYMVGCLGGIIAAVTIGIWLFVKGGDLLGSLIPKSIGMLILSIFAVIAMLVVLYIIYIFFRYNEDNGRKMNIGGAIICTLITFALLIYAVSLIGKCSRDDHIDHTHFERYR